MDFFLDGNFTGSFSLRHLQGSADVESLYGRGEIDVKGLGVAAGFS